MKGTVLSMFLPLLAGCLLDTDDWDAWEQGLAVDDSTEEQPSDTGTAPADSALPQDTGLQDSGTFDTAQAAIELLAVEPAFGPRGGGSPVSLLGTGFDETASVLFDQAGAELVASSEERLEVITPAAAQAGWADVVVQQGQTQSQALQSFRYLDLDDATGQAGAMGALQHFEYVGSYWEPGTLDYGMLQLWFPSEASDQRYGDFFADQAESCRSSAGFELDSSGGIDLEAPLARLVGSGGTELAPSWNAKQRRLDLTLGPTDFEVGASYALSFSGLWDLPDFEIEQILRTPAPLVLESPLLGGSEPPELERDELSFAWQEIEAEQVLVYMVRVSSDGRQGLETLTCLAENDGAFEVPSSAWSGWQRDQVLYVYVGALRESDAQVPLNNGDSRVAGIYWNVGVVVAR